MRKWLAILVTLAACKAHDLERLEAVKRDVCACKDASCADRAMDRIAKASIQSNPRTQALARQIMDCRAKLEAGDRPNTDPDAEGSAAPAAPGSGGEPAAPPATK